MRRCYAFVKTKPERRKKCTPHDCSRSRALAHSTKQHLISTNRGCNLYRACCPRCVGLYCAHLIQMLCMLTTKINTQRNVHHTTGCPETESWHAQRSSTSLRPTVQTPCTARFVHYASVRLYVSDAIALPRPHTVVNAAYFAKSKFLNLFLTTDIFRSLTT